MERGGNKEGRVERGIGEGERRSERERERERAKHWSEKGVWGIWDWVWVWAKSRDKESGSVKERKESTTTNCGSIGGDEQGGRARNF